MLDFDGQVLGKARSAQEVRDRWAAMSGRSGVLVTGHTVIDLDTGRVVERAVATTIRFGRPDPVELEAYIASGEPLAVAGSCTIDGLGGPFIDGDRGRSLERDRAGAADSARAAGRARRTLDRSLGPTPDGWPPS